MFCKKGVLENFAKFTEKHLSQGLFLQSYSFIKNEALAQMFSCEFCEICENIFYIEHLGTTDPELKKESTQRRLQYNQTSKIDCFTAVVNDL